MTFINEYYVFQEYIRQSSYLSLLESFAKFKWDLNLVDLIW